MSQMRIPISAPCAAADCMTLAMTSAMTSSLASLGCCTWRVSFWTCVSWCKSHLAAARRCGWFTPLSCASAACAGCTVCTCTGCTCIGCTWSVDAAPDVAAAALATAALATAITLGGASPAGFAAPPAFPGAAAGVPSSLGVLEVGPAALSCDRANFHEGRKSSAGFAATALAVAAAALAVAAAAALAVAAAVTVATQVAVAERMIGAGWRWGAMKGLRPSPIRSQTVSSRWRTIWVCGFMDGDLALTLEKDVPVCMLGRVMALVMVPRKAESRELLTALSTSERIAIE